MTLLHLNDIASQIIACLTALQLLFETAEPITAAVSEQFSLVLFCGSGPAAGLREAGCPQPEGGTDDV